MVTTANIIEMLDTFYAMEEEILSITAQGEEVVVLSSDDYGEEIERVFFFDGRDWEENNL
jgi:aspartate aminotransferase-like enzyme